MRQKATAHYICALVYLTLFIDDILLVVQAFQQAKTIRHARQFDCVSGSRSLINLVNSLLEHLVSKKIQIQRTMTTKLIFAEEDTTK